MSILIRGGTAVTAEGETRADVLVRGGLIEAVGADLDASADRYIDRSCFPSYSEKQRLHNELAEPTEVERD